MLIGAGMGQGTVVNDGPIWCVNRAGTVATKVDPVMRLSNPAGLGTFNAMFGL